MDNFVTIEQIDRAAAFIRARLHITPKIGMILGTGLADIADEVEDADVIPFFELLLASNAQPGDVTQHGVDKQIALLGILYI